MFCKYHDGAALPTDGAYTHTFLDVLERFSGMAQGRQDINEGLNARTIGMEAMLSAATSPALRVSQTGPQIHAIIVAVLENLKSIKSETLYNSRQQTERSKMGSQGYQSSSRSSGLIVTGAGTDRASGASHGDETSNESLTSLSLYCLRQLFDCNDASQLVQTTSQMLKHTTFTDASNCVWASSIIHIAAEWTPINLRFHLLIACLTSFPKTSSDHWPSSSQENHLHIIHDLLASKVTLIGLSTIDVLDNLMAIAIDCLHKVPTNEQETLKVHLMGSERGTSKSLQTNFIYQIARAIMAINVHLYYNDQLRDIIGVILEKVRSTVSLEMQESDLLCAIFFLDTTSQMIQLATTKHEDSDPHLALPLSTFDSSMPVLHNSAEAVRLKFMNVWSQYCQGRAQGTIFHEESQSREKALEHIRLAVYHYLLLFSRQTSEMHYFTASFQYLWISLENREAESFLPVLYHAAQVSDPDQGQQVRAMDIADILCQILLRSMPSIDCTTLQRTIAANDELPNLAALYKSCEQNSTISGSHSSAHYASSWNPEEISSHTSRAVSIRHIGQSQANGSAVTSREQLFIPGNPASVDNKMQTRITYLKQHLLNPKLSSDKKITAPSSLNLTSMFDGIELQDQYAPHISAQLNNIENAEPSDMSSNSDQASPMPFDTRKLNDVPLLGPVIS